MDTGVAGMFGLNIKLFLAQLLNFGIIVFVMWKWVFPPVVKALEARSSKIKQSLDDARQVAEDKNNFEKWKTEELSNTRKVASDIISKAKTEAESARTELLAKAQKEQERLITQTKDLLEAEQKRSVAEVKEEIATLVVAATEKILHSKLDARADKELIGQALKDVL